MTRQLTITTTAADASATCTNWLTFEHEGRKVRIDCALQAGHCGNHSGSVEMHGMDYSATWPFEEQADVTIDFGYPKGARHEH